ncbi:hypothetical protein [Ramlibacter humi]|uniref:Uncharacterized protein n=1 Tax=Ramlibacter humi TaxID=2530451 RepID=A0A4Z0BE53_9BURK|nr:hypothetical protein [Ramlibacter humi]TFY97596.1 hypothetical protein EZ216_17865 [Ramlibacter humi]
MNAELRRYAWLELGWHRVAVVPLLLGLVSAAVLYSAPNPATTLAWGALGLFLLMTAGWGAMRALASVAEEVRDRTWDFQRMAAVTPAELALGKVFGAPLFQWYAGAWCLAVLAIAGTRAGWPRMGSMLLGLVACAVMLHGLGVAVSAAGARTRIGERSRRIGGLLLVLTVLQMLPLAFLVDLSGDRQAFVRWWGRPWPVTTFAAASAALFAVWAVLAAWRAMLRELQEPARPWPWPAFALFAAAWAGGIATPAMERIGFASAAAVASLVLTVGAYVACLLDPLTRVSLARMARAWRPRAPRWPHRVPPWAIHGALAVLAGAIALLTGRSNEPLPALALVAALMALRDAAVVSCFALASPARSAVGRAVFYIALADLLVPTLAMAVGLPGLAHAVFPPMMLAASPGQAWLAMAVHAMLGCAALAFLAMRARRADAGPAA